jgi:hypothetical protein
LPNGSELPTADSSAEFFWRNLPSIGRTLHRVGPTGQTPYQILVLTPSSAIESTPYTRDDKQGKSTCQLNF